ncbi:MAG: hypothetical protein ACE15E_15580 [Acidobacteriota bacterium]
MPFRVTVLPWLEVLAAHTQTLAQYFCPAMVDPTVAGLSSMVKLVPVLRVTLAT